MGGEAIYSENRTVFLVCISAMVSVLATLVTLLFFQVTNSLPLPGHYLNDIAKDISRLADYSVGGSRYVPSLKNLEYDFYTQKGITHDVFTKKVHSHNDYWRSRPLLDALSLGVQSVEADIWYLPDRKGPDIYVGHSLGSLSENHKLDDLYLDPLYAILSGSNLVNQNPPTDSSAWSHPAGVFDTDSSATLFFLIDFKTNGTLLFDQLDAKLDRFRQNDWLSHYDTKTEQFNWRPITIIGTGNTPLEKVLEQGEIRDIFFDGPLDKLTEENMKTFNLGVSPLVSSSLGNLVGTRNFPISGLDEAQREVMQQQIDLAHRSGLRTRIWDTPWWPVSTKYSIWSQIIHANSDFLNADDLSSAVKFTADTIG